MGYGESYGSAYGGSPLPELGVVATETLSLSARDETTLTLEWHVDDDTQGGDYLATVSSDDEEDTTTISIGGLPDFDNRWAIPTETDWVGVHPNTVDIDDTTISITAHVDEQDRDRLTDLRSSGDESQEETAFGAFRRLRRDDGPIRELIPPNNWQPPFQSREVAPLSYQEDELGPGLYEIDVEFGLEQPRGREPPDIDRDTEVVGSSVVTADGRGTATTTVAWPTNPDDAGTYAAQITTESPDGYESSDTTTLTVSDQEGYALSFATGTISLQPEDVRPLSRSSSDGVEHVTLELDLGPSRVATLMATGSRVEAATIRQVPDGPNRVIDPLPEEDLTATVQAPDDSEIDTGTYVLTDWSITREHPIDRPYLATLELAVVERYSIGDELHVSEGDVYTIPPGTIEQYDSAIIDGELRANGELRTENGD